MHLSIDQNGRHRIAIMFHLITVVCQISADEPSQAFVRGFLRCPTSHWQLYEPTELTHLLVMHRSGIALHSSTSVHIIKFKKSKVDNLYRGSNDQDRCRTATTILPLFTGPMMLPHNALTAIILQTVRTCATLVHKQWRGVNYHRRSGRTAILPLPKVVRCLMLPLSVTSVFCRPLLIESAAVRPSTSALRQFSASSHDE